ncbi:MAG: Gfo/Idh/MocA family protein [Halanaerobiales bacterium]
MEDKVRFGIIGCGVIAPVHAEAIRKAESAEFVACCDVIEERARKMAENEGADYYLDYHKMLAREDIDAVAICTPSGMHSDMTVDCAQAGKDVVCEKPLDIKKDKLDKMISACRKADVKLGGIFQRRTFAASRRIKKATEEGQFGKMVLGDAYLKYFRSQEYYDRAEWRGTRELDGGGALMNQGVHGIDLLQWLMGDVESVYARTDALVRDIEVEDTAVINLKFKSGAFGVIEATTSVYPARPSNLYLHGEKGTVVLEEQEIKEYEVINQEIDMEKINKGLDGEFKDPADPSSANVQPGHIEIIQDFVEAVQEDRDPMITGESARKAVDIILAIYESARTGQEIKVDEFKSS